MPMNYSEFVTYMLASLWRQGDTTVEANLDTLIREANSELDTRLQVEERHKSIVLTATSQDVALPDDLHSIRTLAYANRAAPPLTYVNVADLRQIRLQTSSSYSAFYSIIDKTLLLSGPMTVTDPEDFNLDYRSTIPDFKQTDQSFLADKYLDLYVLAVQKKVALFVREDERLAVINAAFELALTSANEDSAHSKTRGVSASKPLPRQAGIRRRR